MAMIKNLIPARSEEDIIGINLQRRLYDIVTEPKTDVDIIMHNSVYAVLASNPHVLEFRESTDLFAPLVLSVVGRYVCCQRRKTSMLWSCG
jgi:hypothetical protein